MEHFEILVNPYAYYDSQPFHICRWKEGDDIFLAGWNGNILEYNDESVIKMASEKGYKVK